jgi:hypothetical protein
MIWLREATLGMLQVPAAIMLIAPGALLTTGSEKQVLFGPGTNSAHKRIGI